MFFFKLENYLNLLSKHNFLNLKQGA